MKKTVMGIDPGLVNGVAVVEVPMSGVHRASAFTVKARDSKLPWWGKLCQIVLDIKAHVDEYGPDVILIEEPELRSNAAAPSVAKLLALTSVIRYALDNGDSDSCVMVPVAKWKGNLPKDKTRKRMRRRWGSVVDTLDHNAVDALGLVTWWMEER